MVLLVVILLFAWMPTPTLSAGEGEWTTGENGLAVKFEWLELKKAKVSWTPTTDGSSQLYYVQLYNEAQSNFAWKSDLLSADVSSMIIDENENEDLSGLWNAPSGPFPGWTTYPDDSFRIVIRGADHASVTYSIGKPLIVPRTHREVTFKATFNVPVLDLLPAQLIGYLDTVAVALNIPRSDVDYGTRTAIANKVTEVVTTAQVLIEYADAVEANGGWESRDVWRTICRGGNFTT